MQFTLRPKFTEVSDCGRYLITASFTGRGKRPITRWYHAWHGPALIAHPGDWAEGAWRLQSQLIAFRSISRPLISRAMAIGICEEHQSRLPS